MRLSVGGISTHTNPRTSPRTHTNEHTYVIKHVCLFLSLVLCLVYVLFMSVSVPSGVCVFFYLSVFMSVLMS